MVRRTAYLATSLCLILGCASAPAKLPPPKPASATVAAPAPTGVRVEALAEVPGVGPAAWAFVTTDLRTLGNPELVLLVKRAAGEGAAPDDGLKILDSLATAVRKGQRFKEWELGGIPDGMFGRRDLTGIVFGGAVQDNRVKVSAPTMTVLLITQDELQVALHFGAPRVTNLLGDRGEFFPYPPWVDRERKSVCTPAQMKGSPIAQVVARLWIQGAGVWEDLRAQPGQVTLAVTRDAGQQIAKALREVGANHVGFFSMPPPEDADSRLVFTELGDNPAGITRSSGEAAKVAGAFVVLSGSKKSAGALVTEDGFSVFIPEERWGELVESLEAGRPFEVPQRGAALPFAIAVAG
jgi:hypothetical protein